MNILTDENIEIFTDGSCINHARMGAWAFVKTSQGKILKEQCGSVENSTHIEMEMMAVYHALRDTSAGESVTIFTDSKHIVDAINKDKLSKWLREGFKTKKGERAHANLWRALDAELKQKTVTFNFIPAHTGIRFNDHVDRLVRRCARHAAETHHPSSTPD